MPQSDSTDAPKFEFVTEAARRYGVDPRILRDAMAAGDLPYYELGKVKRLKPADVDAWVESLRVGGGSS